MADYQLLYLLVICGILASCDAHSDETADGSCDTISVAMLQRRISSASVLGSDYEHPLWLESCESIFLDVGSNIGVQVRKLYEPDLYPGADFLRPFEEIFGPPSARRAPANESKLCALGLEPNPNHRSHLAAIESAYTSKGWHVHFYPFAVAYEDGMANFTTNANQTQTNMTEDWGASLDGGDSWAPGWVGVNMSVQTVDFGRFVKSLGKHKVKLMKMDVEGAEWDSLASMEAQQVLCGDWIENALMELHGGGSIGHWNDCKSIDAVQARLASQVCQGNQISMDILDDESYLHDQLVPPNASC